MHLKYLSLNSICNWYRTHLMLSEIHMVKANHWLKRSNGIWQVLRNDEIVTMTAVMQGKATKCKKETWSRVPDKFAADWETLGNFNISEFEFVYLLNWNTNDNT